MCTDEDFVKGELFFRGFDTVVCLGMCPKFQGFARRGEGQGYCPVWCESVLDQSGIGVW